MSKETKKSELSAGAREDLRREAQLPPLKGREPKPFGGSARGQMSVGLLEGLPETLVWPAVDDEFGKRFLEEHGYHYGSDTDELEAQVALWKEQGQLKKCAFLQSHLATRLYYRESPEKRPQVMGDVCKLQEQAAENALKINLPGQAADVFMAEGRFWANTANPVRSGLAYARASALYSALGETVLRTRALLWEGVAWLQVGQGTKKKNPAALQSALRLLREAHDCNCLEGADRAYVKFYYATAGVLAAEETEDEDDDEEDVQAAKEVEGLLAEAEALFVKCAKTAQEVYGGINADKVLLRWAEHARGLRGVVQDAIAEVDERSQSAVASEFTETKEKAEEMPEDPDPVETDVAAREDFAGASVGELVEALIPAVPQAAVDRLEELIRAAQENPPEDREGFVRDVNRILDAQSLRIRVDGESLARLRVLHSSRLGSIQFAIPGGSRGFRGAAVEVVKVPSGQPSPAP